MVGRDSKEEEFDRKKIFKLLECKRERVKE